MNELRIGVLGLGYIGLPLAIELAKHFPVIGFDISAERTRELREAFDRTHEVEASALRASTLQITSEPEALASCRVYIVTVPTPVDERNRPDLRPLRGAAKIIAGHLKRADVVVLESTVYPGLTEEIFGKELAALSGLGCGTDFFLGYSPERINPGDRQHTIGAVTKIVAGQTPEVLDLVSDIYSKVTSGRIFRAANIKVAEAAKVIENAQRDINIAFVNELAKIFGRMDISVHDVLEAAATKWNFVRFAPGLVGGHCIGVDPFYLAQCATEHGYRPELVLAGRRINETMSEHIADRIAERLERQLPPGKPGRVLVLGITFKENVPDLRNSKVADLVQRLSFHGHAVDVHDPYADPAEAEREYGVTLLPTLETNRNYHCLIVAVPHREYAAHSITMLTSMLVEGGLFADIKGLWRGQAVPEAYQYWTL